MDRADGVGRAPSETGSHNPEEVAASLRAALAEHDAKVAECPFKRRRTPPSDKPCPKCGATVSDSCFPAVLAAYRFVETARSILIAEK